MIKQPQNYWKLGAFVMGGALLLFGFLIWFGTRGLSRETFDAVTYFDESVEGLSVGSPVKFRGVALGKVTEIAFAPNRRDVEVGVEIYYDLLVELGLRTERPVPGVNLGLEEEGVRVQLSRSGLTGITFLEMDVFDDAVFPARELEFDPPWNHLPSQPSTLKGIENSINETMQRLPGLAGQVEQFLASFESSVGELDLGAAVAEVRRSVTRVDQLLAAVDPASVTSIVSRTEASLVQLEDLLGSARGPLDAVGRAAESVEASVAEIDPAQIAAAAERALEGVDAAARAIEGLALGRAGLGAQASRQLDQLGRTLSDFSALLQLLERNPGALLRGRSPDPNSR